MLLLAAAITLAMSPAAPSQACVGARTAASLRRGSILLAAFNGPAAAAAFRSAERASPRCAEAALGLSQASGPNLNVPISERGFAQARVAIGRAMSLGRKASPSTRRLMETVSIRYAGTFSDFPRTNDRYIDALRRLARSGDAHSASVQLLLVQALLEKKLGPSLWTQREARERNEIEALLSSLLARDPSDLLANHLAIHFHDFDPDRSAALRSADRLASLHLEPDAEHLTHMAAHAYVRAGRYERAVGVSAKALALERHAAFHLYRDHDFFVGEGAAFMGSDFALARSYIAAFCDPRKGSCHDLLALAAMRFERWDDLVRMTEGHQDPLSLMLLTRALVARGEVHRADATFAQLRRAAPRLAEEPNETSISLALAHRDRVRSIALVRRLRLESPATMPEMLPLFPARELAGRALLAAGRRREAIALLQADLRLYPCSVRAESMLAQASGRRDRRARTCSG